MQVLFKTEYIVVHLIMKKFDGIRTHSYHSKWYESCDGICVKFWFVQPIPAKNSGSRSKLVSIAARQIFQVSPLLSNSTLLINNFLKKLSFISAKVLYFDKACFF